MIGLYHYHRLDCSNVFNSLGLAGGTKLAMGFFHASEETAYRDFVQFFKLIMEISPYFRKQYNTPPIRLISSGPKSTGSVIGTQLIYCVLSEIGFWKPADAKAKVDEVLVRYNSRFANKRFHFGSVVADSSAKDADSNASQKFEESVPENELFRIQKAQWEIRPELYAESKGVTFDFYRGDSKRVPRIIQEGENTDDLDKNRIIKVPISAKIHFINNPIRALNDLAGFPYSGKDLFFDGDLSHLMSCSIIKNTAPEEVTVDFYDKSETIYEKVETMIHRIPRGTHLFIHYDIGLKKDKCGVALCYYNGEVSDSSGNASYPTFRFPLIFTVSRKSGQSTSLDKLYQFLRQLAQMYTITFSADSFASAGMFQSCERDGIDYKMISIDRTTDAAFMFKNVVNTDRCELPYNNILLRECSELRLLNNGTKVDHPAVSGCTDFDYAGKDGEQPGTKDQFDACCGALYSCYLKYSEYLEGGYSTGIKKQMSAIQGMTSDPREEAGKAIQGMLESIF